MYTVIGGESSPVVTIRRGNMGRHVLIPIGDLPEVLTQLPGRTLTLEEAKEEAKQAIKDSEIAMIEMEGEDFAIYDKITGEVLEYVPDELSEANEVFVHIYGDSIIDTFYPELEIVCDQISSISKMYDHLLDYAIQHGIRVNIELHPHESGWNAIELRPSAGEEAEELEDELLNFWHDLITKPNLWMVLDITDDISEDMDEDQIAEIKAAADRIGVPFNPNPVQTR